MCLTVDRYLAVVKPLRHRALMNRRTAYRMLVVVYFLSILLAIIPILGKARYRYHAGTNHCSPTWSNSCGYAAGMTTVGFILPILGMLITYTRIFLTLRKKRVLMNRSSPSSETSMQDSDSNSMGNFEDTSTDRSGESAIRMTAHRMLDDPEEGMLESAIQSDSTKEHLGESSTETRKEMPTIRGYPNQNFVGHVSAVGSSSDKHLESIKSIDKMKTVLGDDGKMNEDFTNNGANDASVICQGALVSELEAMCIPDSETANNDDARTSSVNVLLKRSSSRMGGESSSVIDPGNGVIIPGIRLPGEPTEPSREDPDRDGTPRANNKQVSFQASAKVSPQKKEGSTEKRLSSISPVARSRKAINFIVSRMKKQKAIRHEYRIARTGTILVLSFLVLWMPYVVAHSCFIGTFRSMTFYNIATFLVYTNALANPIIYALTNRAVMQDIRRSMGRLCRST